MFFNAESLKTTQDVDNAARELAKAWDISFPPAPSFDGRKKNKLRDMVCELAGFNGGFQTFLSKLEEAELAEPPISVDTARYGSITIVDGIEINDEVFDQEMVDWKLASREDFISDLRVWIGEAARNPDRQSDYNLMIEDLEILTKWDDEYIWSSIDTNAYLSPQKDTKEFNEVCREVLKAHSELESKA
ncbi:hypothetical protein [Vibrio owensii]|uniref:hypothetical protein n=1 Tax=Vibrio owensii TaxID=696485 RepID=UPI003CC51C4D